MDKLKSKNGLTIVAAVCIVLSIFGGFGFSSAAAGVNKLFHVIFPQYVESTDTKWHRRIIDLDAVELKYPDRAK